MRKLEVVGINNFSYTLKDDNGKEYLCNFEFHDLEKEIFIGNTIYIDEGILSYPMLYAYGKITDKDVDDKDLMIIIDNGEKLYLQRYYG